MNVLQYTATLFLAAAGLALTIVLLWFLLSALFLTVAGTRDYLKFRKAAQRLKRVDELLEGELYADALKELRRSVVFDARSSRQLIATLRDHHQNVLSRCLVISEALGSRSENIANIEQLFLERTELQLLLLKAHDAYRRLQDRREQAGKALPAWSQADYDKRLRDVASELLRNKRVLIGELDTLFSNLQAPPKPEEIVYH